MSELKKIPMNPNLAVEGFNPEDYIQEHTNSNGEKLSRLPFNAQLMWFRLRYPEGKISVETRPGKSVVIAKARVYANRNDPVDAFIAEGESSRGPSSDMPSINPRNWAQTAAIGTALRYAGFGLECDLAGEAPETISGEWDELMDNPPSFNVSQSEAKNKIESVVEDGSETTTTTPPSPDFIDYENMSDEEALKAAQGVTFKNGKFKGKTVVQALTEKPNYAAYVLNNFDHDDPLYRAVKVFADAALRLED